MPEGVKVLCYTDEEGEAHSLANVPEDMDLSTMNFACVKCGHTFSGAGFQRMRNFLRDSPAPQIDRRETY